MLVCCFVARLPAVIAFLCFGFVIMFRNLLWVVYLVITGWLLR